MCNYTLVLIKQGEEKGKLEGKLETKLMVLESLEQMKTSTDNEMTILHITMDELQELKQLLASGHSINI